MISIIAAIGKNNEIGKNNQLLWKLPADMKHFRELTTGNPVIMGRKTFESIGKSLPERINIVVSRDKNYLRDQPGKVVLAGSVDVVQSLEEGISKAKNSGAKEIFIIGGAEIYKQAIPLADRLYITYVVAEDKKADAFFPEIIPVVWNEISHEEHEADEKNPYKHIFSVYERL